MLTILVNLLMLHFFSYILGRILLKTLHPSTLSTETTYLARSLLGLLILINISQFASLFNPIASYRLIFFGIMTAVIISQIKHIKKIDVRYCLLALAISAYASGVIYWGDSGSYHMALVGIANEYGTVAGLGAIDQRYGSLSSIFSFTSLYLFSEKIKIYQIVNVTVLLMLIFFVVNIKNYVKNFTGMMSALWFGMVFILALRWGVIISPSPDLLPIVMPFLCALVLFDKNGNIEQKLFLIAVFGALSLSIRLSSLPLLFLPLILLLSRHNELSLRKILFNNPMPIAIIIGSLFVTLTTNIIATGYPFYPSSILKLDLEWTLPLDSVNEYSAAIHNFAKCGAIAYSNGSCSKMTDFEIIINWATSRVDFVSALMILSCIFLGILTRNQTKAYEFKVFRIWIFSSVIFILWSAPTLRFLVGYLALYISLSCAMYLRSLRPQI